MSLLLSRLSNFLVILTVFHFSLLSIVFMTMASNSANRDFAWEWFKEHFKSIHERFASSTAIFKVCRGHESCLF